MKKKSDKQSSDEWKIIVARNFEEIEAIRPIWEQMQRNEPCSKPNADIDRYRSVVGSRSDSIRPHVMLFEHNGNPAAMIVGWVGKHQLELKLGYKALLKPKLRCLTVVYGGVLGQPDSELCSLLVGQLMKQLRSQEVDMVYLNHLKTDSLIYQAVRGMPGFLCRSYFLNPEIHYRMSVPDNIELFYQLRSAKHRKHLKQYVKKLETSYPDQVKMVTYSREEELDDVINAVSQISSKTYQYAIGHGFVDNTKTRTLLTTAARMGWLRAHILFICNEPCAFRFALHYGKTYIGNGIGFDTKWKQFRVGTILFLNVVEKICKEPTVDFYDFGFGYAEYKESYGNEKWLEASCYIFAPRLYPVFVNVLRSSVMMLNAALQYVVHKIGFEGWIKRRWRNLLQAKNPGSKGEVGR
jgi:hypothetical protein